MNDWQAIIGLEIHVQLNTKTKLFSFSANHFGSEVNTNISEICTGQPGSLPLVNEEAIKKAILFGLAVNAEISNIITFDRKSYFYPDSPRNFQITQFEHPIIKKGKISIDLENERKTITINHAHLEDDSGMLKHFSSFAGVDYNRAGVPLLEIVSDPVMYSSKEAVLYIKALKSIMEYINISNCNMEEGSLRVDANISIRRKSEKKLRNKTEIKNLNSFTFLEKAIETEIKRQILIYEENDNAIIESCTYRWDQPTKNNILMRKKEMANDYRYCPEPDIPPIFITKDIVEKIKQNLSELPQARLNRYVQVYNLPKDLSFILVDDKDLSDFYEKALETTQNKKLLCNWLITEFLGRAKAKEVSFLSLNLNPQYIGELINLIDKEIITGKIAKKIADEMILNPSKNPKDIVKENPNYKPIDDSLVLPIILQVIKDNPQSIKDFKQGKNRAFGYLVGEVMRLTKGKANPAFINKILKEKINNI